MIRRALTYIFAVYFFVSSALLVAIAALICAITAPFDPLRKTLHRFAAWWGYHYLQINPFWRCRWDGRERIPQAPCVLVANHQSYWDIMVLYGLGVPFKWVSKDSIFNMPFIGWNLYLNQCVRIVRGDLKSIKDMMHDCRRWLERGASIMIFPEGTRSEDGEIAAFRDGPFKLAAQLNVPVVPIVVDGTHEILPKNGRHIGFVSDVTVKILPAVYPAEFDGKVRQMRDSVQQKMIECLRDLRNHPFG